jgi:hypothetical protein
MPQPHDEELTALETALGGLAPAPAPDRDRILFEAGRAAARPPRLWPLTAAALALACTGLGGALWLRPGPQTVERVVYLLAPAPPAAEPRRAADPAPEAPPDWGARERERFGSFRLTRDALRWGVDNLPLAPATAVAGPPGRLGEVPTYMQLRDSLRSGGEL